MLLQRQDQCEERNAESVNIIRRTAFKQKAMNSIKTQLQEDKNKQIIETIVTSLYLGSNCMIITE
jgi:hypothetical protein